MIDTKVNVASQVVSWYQFTTNCGYTELAEACLNFIKWLLVALRWTIIHRLHLKIQFQVELHSGLHLNRLASPGTWFSSSHPWVQWSCYSGGLSFEIVLFQQFYSSLKGTWCDLKTFSPCTQGEMTVFRAVESWLCARREEMSKEGEEEI